MKITQVVLTVPYEGEMGGRIKNAKKKKGGAKVLNWIMGLIAIVSNKD